MNEILSLYHTYMAAHPAASSAVSLLLGLILGPQALGWVETVGVDKVTAWGDARQKALLARAGLTPQQIISVRKHEVEDGRRALDDEEKAIQADEAALAAPTAKS